MADSFGRLLAECVATHGRFGHVAHLHLAWSLLERHPALEALARFDAGLRALAAAHGNSEKYNATLTTACFLLLLERRRPGEDWGAFAARNPDLLNGEGRPRWLGPFYDLAVLGSPEARRGFVMPRAPAGLERP